MKVYICNSVIYRIFTKLNGLFDVVDNATDALSSISDKMVLLVSSGITSLISKFRKKGEDSDEK